MHPKEKKREALSLLEVAIEHIGVRNALREVSKRTKIPEPTLRHWYYNELKRKPLDKERVRAMFQDAVELFSYAIVKNDELGEPVQKREILVYLDDLKDQVEYIRYETHKEAEERILALMHKHVTEDGWPLESFLSYYARDLDISKGTLRRKYKDRYQG
jgi:hypothetical protein